MSGAPEFYPASPIKRHRATRAEREERLNALLVIAEAAKPATVRGIVEKTESGYAKLQTDLVWLRRNELLPYGWIVDNTRWQRRPRSFESVEQALQDTARLYRKSLWADARTYVEIWLEKDALSGVVYPVTSLYDVPLMVARGYASLSFLHSAAEYISKLDIPTFIYHLGDFDPSGVNAGEKIEGTLRELAPQADILFHRIAVTPDQIEKWNLPTRPTKKSDSRARNFTGDSVELDAIEPSRLRELVEMVIERHLPAEQFAVLKAAEESERTQIRALVDAITGAAR